MADPARFELTTSAFGGQRSIQLSYGSGAQNIPERPRGCNAAPIERASATSWASTTIPAYWHYAISRKLLVAIPWQAP
jgi:hypothetical protein